MKKLVEKILERLEKERIILLENNLHQAIALNFAKGIVQEVAEEYNGDMKYNLAEMYAKNMVEYGVNVTKAWQTATQQSCALEKAYIRGRQYEVDRFNELRKEYNGGWIACSERLPEESLNSVIGWDEYRQRCCFVQYYGGRWILGNDIDSVKIIAWQPLPKPYKERD